MWLSCGRAYFEGEDAARDEANEEPRDDESVNRLGRFLVDVERSRAWPSMAEVVSRCFETKRSGELGEESLFPGDELLVRADEATLPNELRSTCMDALLPPAHRSFLRAGDGSDRRLLRVDKSVALLLRVRPHVRSSAASGAMVVLLLAQRLDSTTARPSRTKPLEPRIGFGDRMVVSALSDESPRDDMVRLQRKLVLSSLSSHCVATLSLIWRF